MNKDELERNLLLRQSGELSAHERQRLESILANDPDARQQAEDLDKLAMAWKNATADTPMPGKNVLQRIHQAAADSQGKTGRLIHFRLPSIGVAMAAALAVIGLGVTLYLVHLPTAQPSPKHQQVSLDPVDVEIAAALEAFDESMLALLDVPSEESISDNDS